MSNPLRFRCPVCGQTVTLHITPTTTPVCHHTNTPQHGHRPKPMNQESPT